MRRWTRTHAAGRLEYASGGATSAQVARGLGISPTAVRNWKRSMLADDKERTMAHRTRTKGDGTRPRWMPDAIVGP